MSFILDALRKSENDRQQSSSAEFANVPTSGGERSGPPAWLWIVGALLLVNLVVLIGILMRPGPEPVQTVTTAQPAATTEPDDFAERVAAARLNAPPVETVVEEPITEDPSATIPEPAPIPATQAEYNPAALPTIHQVQANGLVSLPPLHVDIHVFSDSAEDRFVFINMAKHNEGSRLSEGPLIEEITPDGVVLKHNGVTFLLPRD